MDPLSPPRGSAVPGTDVPAPASWSDLADPRYDYLLDEENRAIARAASELARLIDSAGSDTWARLRQTLGQYGLAAP